MGNKRGSRGHDTLKQVEARNDITEKMTVEQNLDENEGKDMDRWKKNIQSKRNSKWKDSEVGSRLVFSKDNNGKKAKVAGGKRKRDQQKVRNSKR